VSCLVYYPAGLPYLYIILLPGGLVFWSKLFVNTHNGNCSRALWGGFIGAQPIRDKTYGRPTVVGRVLAQEGAYAWESSPFGGSDAAPPKAAKCSSTLTGRVSSRNVHGPQIFARPGNMHCGDLPLATNAASLPNTRVNVSPAPLGTGVRKVSISGRRGFKTSVRPMYFQNRASKRNEILRTRGVGVLQIRVCKESNYGCNHMIASFLISLETTRGTIYHTAEWQPEIAEK
jgi:hypothetical protein